MIGDIDGDGKNDVVAATRSGWSVLRNTSDTGFSFQRVDFAVNNSFVGIGGIGDIDGDGKPDIIVEPGTSSRSDSIQIFKNTSTPGNFSFVEKAIYIAGDAPTNAVIGDLNGDGKPEVTVAVTVPASTSKMVAILGNNGVAGPNIVQLCSGTNTSITAGNSGTAYQWQMDAGTGFANINDNSNLAGTHTAVLTLNNVPATWNNYQFRCLVDAIAGSIYKMAVSTSLTPSVVISGNTMVNQGQSATINATLTNGGASPAYQWQDSTAAHTWQDVAGATSNTLAYTPAATSNKLRVVITTYSACGNLLTVTSMPIAFIVNGPTAISPVPAADYGIHVYPNPVTTLFTIDTLSLSDQWQTLEVRDINGKQELIRNIQNQTSVVVEVERLSAGVYLTVLRRKSGEAVYVKFVKI